MQLTCKLDWAGGWPAPRGIISRMVRKTWLGLLAWCAFAAYDPAIFSSLTWRSIGPARGGRSIASAGSSSRPLEYYFGATGGGLWKTTDPFVFRARRAGAAGAAARRPTPWAAARAATSPRIPPIPTYFMRAAR